MILGGRHMECAYLLFCGRHMECAYYYFVDGTWNVPTTLTFVICVFAVCLVIEWHAPTIQAPKY
jgi:hypothetical protein